MNGLTALRGLELLDLAAGESLAVSGGAGLLASYVIALAHERGLRVIADAKAGDEELVRGFGADVVVARSDDFAAAVRQVEPDGVAGVYDTALLNDAALGATPGRWRARGRPRLARRRRPSAGSRCARCSCARCSSAPSGCRSCAGWRAPGA